MLPQLSALSPTCRHTTRLKPELPLLGGKQDMKTSKAVSLSDVEKCRFYYDQIDSQLATRMLKDKSIGTFLVRASCHPNHKLCISAKSASGVIHLRVGTYAGQYSVNGTKQSPGSGMCFDTMEDLLDMLMAHPNLLGMDDCYGRVMGVMKLTKPLCVNL